MSRHSLPLKLLPLMSLLTGTALAEATAPGVHWNLGGKLRYEDNVYRTLDRFAESDTSFILKPELAWLAVRGKHLFDIRYAGEYAFYFDVTDLNYDDHDLRARARFDHSYRLSSEVTLGYLRSHDVPGSNDAVSIPLGEADKWRESLATGKVAYGRDDSHGQFVGMVGYHQRRYTNNHREYRDYNLWKLTGIFYYRIAPKTRLLFEAELEDYDYQNEDRFGLNQTNRTYRLYTGVIWKATAKTSGTFKLGYRDTNYDDARFGDLSGLALWLDGEWKPNTYTRVTVGASQDNQASAQQSSNGYVRRYFHGGIEHGITARTLLIGFVQYGRDSFEGPGNREDDRWDARVGVRHSLRRWLDLTLEYRYEERDSNFDLYDYDDNIFRIALDTRFD